MVPARYEHGYEVVDYEIIRYSHDRFRANVQKGVLHNYFGNLRWVRTNRVQMRKKQCAKIINIVGGLVNFFVCDRCWGNQLYGLYI